MKNYSLFAFAIIILAACNSGKTSQNFEEGALYYDTIEVSIDYPFLSKYTQHSAYVKHDTLFWSGYNHMTHSIDIFDLTNLKACQSIQLEKEGPNSIIDVINFTIADTLLLFIDYQNNLNLYSRLNNNVLKRISPVADTEYRMYYNGVLSGSYISSVSMRLKESSLMFPIFPIKDQAIDDLLAVEMDLSTLKQSYLPLKYPDEMKEDLTFYSSLSFISLMNYDDRIVYNFPYSSNVYVYWKNNASINILPMESKMTDNKTRKLESPNRRLRELFKYEDETLRFREPYYCKEYDKYLRVHHDYVDKNTEQRESFLMSYNNTTKKTTEYKLPASFTPIYFVENNKLFFLLKSNDDSSLKFAVIELAKI